MKNFRGASTLRMTSEKCPRNTPISAPTPPPGTPARIHLRGLTLSRLHLGNGKFAWFLASSSAMDGKSAARILMAEDSVDPGIGLFAVDMPCGPDPAGRDTCRS